MSGMQVTGIMAALQKVTSQMLKEAELVAAETAAEMERYAKTTEELFAEGKISTEEYNAHIDRVRQSAYQQEADPLGFKVLRGEIEKTEWLEKIAEIKKRYPKK